MAAPPKTSPLIFLTALFLTSSSATDELLSAMEEMQKANYFSFVMLLKMSGPSLTGLRNVTFLMPNDKTLSRTTITPESLSEFLLRHSIPSPLLFDHLHLIPSGSLLPSAQPGYMLKVANGGRRSFYLNTVRILSPNICTSRWSSIRCHGIDALLPLDTGFSPPACSNITPPAAPPPSLPHPLPIDGDQDPASPPAPISGSSKPTSPGSWELKLLLAFLLISWVRVPV